VTQRTKADEREVARRLLTRWKNDPILLAKEVFGTTVWEAPPPGIRKGAHGQGDIARACTTHNWVSVRSGQKTGKSTIACILGWWWIMTRPNARVLFTAPSFPQVERVLWREFKRLYNSSLFPIGGVLNETAHTGFKLSDGREAFGRTVAKVDAMQGLSGANQMVIVDEASGYAEATLEAVFGNMSGGGLVVMLGNPVRPSGTFYQSHTSKRGTWCSLHISSLDTPNHTGLSTPISGLSDPSFLEFARSMWGGPGNPAWDVRIDGNFPSSSIDTIISLALIEQAKSRYEETVADGFLSVGVDCAGFGDDDSVVIFRRGKKVLGIHVFHNLDGPDLAGKVLALIPHYRPINTPASVKVDHVGEGASCFDALSRAARDHNLEVYGVNNGASSTVADSPDRPGYANLGTQLYFGTKEWFKEGGALPSNDVARDPVTGNWSETVNSDLLDGIKTGSIARLEGELSARKYSFDERGRYVIERKKDFKARNNRSPDLGDALALAVYDPPPMGRVHVRGQRKLSSGMGGF
jgi:hypothetical protein